MQNYIGSLLSNIAYLNLNSTNFNNGKLTIAGMEEASLNTSDMLFFNEYFTMKEQSPESDLFTGSVITNDKDLILGDSTIMKKDTVSIAYRGTQESDDWLTDIGLAYDSSVSLYKDLNLLTVKLKDGEIDFQNIDMNDILLRINNFGSNSSLSLIAGQRQAALNYFYMVQNKYSSNDINLYGHSLGGYLANYVTVMDQNSQNINETITYNAPGFSTTQIIIMQIAAVITQFKEYSNSEQISVELQNSLNEIISSIDLKFNISSLDKLNSIYSTRGIEFTSSDVLGMGHPELRYPLYTDPSWNTHSIVGLREILCAYDSLSCFMPGGSTLKNYEYITTIIEGFSKHLGFDSDFRAGDEVLNQISKFIGIPSTTGIDVLTYVNSLSNINQYTFKRTDELSYVDIASGGNEILYSLINYIPFTITGANQINDDKYNPENYTKETIDARFKLFNEIMSLKGNDINTVGSSINEFQDYKIFFNDKNQSNFLYIDTVNKLMYTNDLNVIVDTNAAILNKNLKTTYFKDNGSLIINTFNNIIYDHYSSDHITLNRGETVLYLSYGNDTINIDSGAGAIIKELTIEDDGLDDLFIFNGGNSGDFITGTKYTDKIIGYEGNDNLFGGDGNDTMMGDEGDDFIFGENGNDTLNGGDGNDHLMGGSGSNSLDGGDGDDTLNAYNTLNEYHDIRGDTLSGGSGTNTLFGTGYGDTYIYGGGIDTIRESDKNFGLNYVDKLLFSSNIQSSQVGLYNILNNLVILINGLEKIFVIDYYNNNYSYLDEIHFINPITGYPIIWNTNYILQHTINTMDKKLIIGTNNDETINGTESDDYIEGRDGNDILNGGDGNDIIYGGNGNDTIHGNNGDDILYGDQGDDQLNGDAGNDIIFGGDGIDTINGGADDDQLNGDAGNDIIFGGIGIDTINGGSGDDQLNGDAGNDIIFGGDGIDTINGGADNDIIYGGAGNDIIDGGTGNDELHGGDGSDMITGGLGNDIIYGDDGDDTITISGTVKTEFDKIYGGSGVDTISNAINNTYIRGGNDADKIFTSGENVDIDGETGNDTIYMSTGSGYLRGGAGADTFVNNGNPSATNYTIEGGIGDDIINMSRGNHTIIYNNGDGNDRIIINGTNVSSQVDTIKLNGYSKQNITSNKLVLFDSGKSLKIQLDQNNSISLVNFLTSKTSMYNLNYFQFDDGVLTSDDLMEIFTHIKGTENNDIYYDTIFYDTFDMSGGGNDFISLRSGFDTVYGGETRTEINISSSNNIIYSGSGADQISLTGNYSNVFNLKDSNNGHDSLFGNGSSKTIINVSSNIYISDMKLNGTVYFYTFSWANDSSINFRTDFLNKEIVFNVNGSAISDLNILNLNGNNDGNYLKILTDRSQTVHGNGGNDTIYGNVGNDTIYGDDGEDYIEDKYGNNTIFGGNDNDRIMTGSGNDTIYGGGGDDIISSGSGIDTVYGGDGDDNIGGSINPDSKYYGGAGNDKYSIGAGTISDFSGLNELYFGRHYTAKVDLISTGTGFNLFINGEHKISYSGSINRIESSSTPPDGYTYRNSLVGGEITRLFEIQAALESETDTSKITAMNTEISNLWKYDQP